MRLSRQNIALQDVSPAKNSSLVGFILSGNLVEGSVEKESKFLLNITFRARGRLAIRFGPFTGSEPAKNAVGRVLGGPRTTKANDRALRTNSFGRFNISVSV